MNGFMTGVAFGVFGMLLSIAIVGAKPQGVYMDNCFAYHSNLSVLEAKTICTKIWKGEK